MVPLGIVAILVTVYVVAEVVGQLAKAASDVEEGVVNAVGRRESSRSALPLDLSLAEPTPRHTPCHDELALCAYSPRTATPRRRPMPSFTSTIDRLLPVVKAPGTKANIAELASLLVVPSELPYDPIARAMGRDLSGGSSMAEKPPYIPPPPTWTAWEPQVVRWRNEPEDPVLHLPLYTGWRRVFNGWVRRAHRDAASQVEDARKRLAQARRDIAERNASYAKQANTRNDKVRQLHQLATQKWEVAKEAQERAFATVNEAYALREAAVLDEMRGEAQRASALLAPLSLPGYEGLTARVELALRTSSLPAIVPREFETRIDDVGRILILEHRFPVLSEVQWTKTVVLRSGAAAKPATQRERGDACAALYPSLCLRLATEVRRADVEASLQVIAVNGWVEYAEPSTGTMRRAYCASLFATVAELDQLDLAKAKPVPAFARLKGVAAPSIEVVPVLPVVRLRTDDTRFVEPKAVLPHLRASENLAAMDWESFEHLCRELFERAFSSTGAEVKVTQASRDQGVDAVVFDPEPLRGGKTIIQAKRYTNTVDVAAVRELYGTVINEGALKGILVTTSHFGPDAYAFARDKPLTLLNGGELLGLLAQYGYAFRIDLAEAKARARSAALRDDA